MNLYVFADERKKINARWDYLGLAIVPQMHGKSLYDDLQQARKQTGFDGEMKFGELHKKGIGSRVETARRWIELVLDDSLSKTRRLFFSVTGIDNSLLDFCLFGPGGTPSRKYANVYNRFFRASLRGMLNYSFGRDLVTIRRVFHDTEGNLENHDYFEWHVIQEIGAKESRIRFADDQVRFVHSDPRREVDHPRASELIQLVDLILGTATYVIQQRSSSNEGQLECARLLYPWVREVVERPYAMNGKYDQLRRFSIVHFPKHPQYKLDESAVPGEYYQPSCSHFESLGFGQGELEF